MVENRLNGPLGLRLKSEWLFICFHVSDDCQIKNSKYENVTKIEGKLTLRWIYYEEILYNKNA